MPGGYPMFKVIVYEDDQGYSPFEKFYNELDEKARTDKSARGLIKKLNYCIGILSEGGTRAGEKFTKAYSREALGTKAG